MGCHFLSRDLPDPGIKPTFPVLAGGFFTAQPDQESSYSVQLISFPHNFPNNLYLLSILSYLEFENHSPGLSAYFSLTLFSVSLLNSSFSALSFSHPTHCPHEYTDPSNCNIYLLTFWKLQFRLLFRIPHISTWMCTDTPQPLFLTLVLTLLLWRDLSLRCHHHLLSYWSQKSKHDPCPLSLKPKPLDITKFCLFYFINNYCTHFSLFWIPLVQVHVASCMTIETGSKLVFPMPVFPLLTPVLPPHQHFSNLKIKVLVVQSCPILCDPMDCSLPGSRVHGILQARILEWVAILFSRGSPQPRDQTQVSCIASGFFTSCATREAQEMRWSPDIQYVPLHFSTLYLTWDLMTEMWT